jgi:hypothetical protein
MRTRLSSFVLCIVVAAPLQADVVTDWTGEMLEAVRTLKPAPPVASRQMALVSTAMFDAVNGIDGSYEPYNAIGSADPSANAAAAAATAAHDCLVAVYPTRSARFAARLAVDLAAIPDGAAKSLGIAWGASVAAQAVAARADDGASHVVAYEPAEGAGWWAPTLPAYQQNPALPHWGAVRPWGVDSASRFRPPVPPSVRHAYQRLHEVYEIGRVDSTTHRRSDRDRLSGRTAQAPRRRPGTGSRSPASSPRSTS